MGSLSIHKDEQSSGVHVSVREAAYMHSSIPEQTVKFCPEWMVELLATRPFSLWEAMGRGIGIIKT